jgi:hypothetical protein
MMTDTQQAQTPKLSADDRSKDEFFVKVALVAEAMIEAHGKDFAMGALILAARFIAEGKPLLKPQSEPIGEWMAHTAPPQPSPARQQKR